MITDHELLSNEAENGYHHLSIAVVDFRSLLSDTTKSVVLFRLSDMRMQWNPRMKTNLFRSAIRLSSPYFSFRSEVLVLRHCLFGFGVDEIVCLEIPQMTESVVGWVRGK